MNKLSSIAAKTFYDITRKTYLLGLLSWEQVIHRLAFLYELTDDLTIREKLFFIAGDDIENKTMEESDNGDIDSNPECDAKTPACPFSSKDCSPLALIVKNIGRKIWNFHQYDHDFFPSIPHGKNSDGVEKLDVYLGWVYKKSQQVQRVKRREIIFLWNDNKFRKFSLMEIDWYYTTYPLYRWRVPNPYKIPRKLKS